MQNPYRAESKINPQKEGHHREIANDVFDALISARLSGGEYQVVCSIIERTWGHPLKAVGPHHSRVISLGHFEKVTNLSRQGVIDAVGNLEKKRIIATERNGTKGTEYLFNKHYDTWLVKQSLLVAGEPLVKQSLPDWSSRVDQPSQVELTSTSQVPEPSTEPPIESIETIESIERAKSSPINNTSPKKPTPKKKRFGEFSNVLLTNEEYQKLNERFGTRVPEMIETLSSGIESKGYKYKSHYAALLNWERREQKKGDQHGTHRQRPGKLPDKYSPAPEYSDL